MILRGYLYIIAPKMQHIVCYASFSMSYVFLYLIGLAQVISFLFYGRLLTIKKIGIAPLMTHQVVQPR
ncbi:hypothetical protein A7K95_08730 [Pediococcus parvulus]|uniref:Uncharacterized protein n=1 Tax=Pediococcus parvulus TaxID=54062 RepID=A0ABX2UEI1_9LACO|nr:hypothetical protein A7K95_08730 [Pediococcus parvulus]